MAVENFDGIQPQEETIDLRALFYKFVRYWYLFALTVFVAFVVAFLFNKYTNPVFEVSTSVLVKDDKSKLDPSAMLGIGLSNTQQNVENEIGILSSFSLTYRSIQNLGFEVSYFIDEGLVSKELYKNSPFEVVFDTSVAQAVGLKYDLKFINKNTFKIDAEGELTKKYVFGTNKYDDGVIERINWTGEYAFGELIETPFAKFTVILTNSFDPELNLKENYNFIFSDYYSLTQQFRGFDIEPINREASILNIKMKKDNIHKAVDFLNMLTHIYLTRSLEQKNQIADNTIRFIDNQLNIISDSLNSAEINLQEFQSKNEVMDMSFQAQQVFRYIEDLQKQQAELEVKSRYYNNLRNYIVKNSENIDELVAPSAMGIEDPVLNTLVGELIALYNKKTENLLYLTEKSSTILSMNTQIRSTQNAILGNINNIIQNSNQALVEIDKRI
ncbi:MAG: hypothetical protein KKB74_03315, partial [Bacteroidetes bacterium]|nr:hypothetical protein [Bacteroidota bacterium]